MHTSPNLYTIYYIKYRILEKFSNWKWKKRVPFVGKSKLTDFLFKKNILLCSNSEHVGQRPRLYVWTLCFRDIHFWRYKQYLNEIKVQCCDVNFKNKIELFMSLDFNFLLQQVLNLFKFHSIQCIKNPILYFISIRALFYFS